MGQELCTCQEAPIQCLSGNGAAGDDELLSLHAKYEVLNEIANGYSSLVFFASSKEDGANYALKVSFRQHTAVLQDRRIDTTNLHEVDATTIKHPHILPHLDIFTTQDIHAVVTLYSPGGTLEDHVLEPCNSFTRLNVREHLARLSSYFRQVVSACHYLHFDCRLIHGNIKLENIFFRDVHRSSVMLGDLSRLVECHRAARTGSGKFGDYTGAVIYLAPEIVAGRPLSPESDVYAVGASVCIALEGRSVLQGPANDLEQVEKAIVGKQGSRLLRLKNSNVHGPVLDFVSRAVEYEKASRPRMDSLLSHPWFMNVSRDELSIGGPDSSVRLFLISDDGYNYDSELAKVFMSDLLDRLPLRITGCFAGRGPGKLRAQLVKGTLMELGLDAVPVAVGEDDNVDPWEVSQQRPHEFRVPYMARESQLWPHTGETLCKEALMRSPDRGVTFVLHSSAPGGLVRCLKSNTELFIRKVAGVMIFCEASVRGRKGDPNGSLKLVPDTSSMSDADGGQMIELFTLLQSLGVPMTVLSRRVAEAVKLPAEVFQTLSRVQHPVAQRLSRAYRLSIEKLWELCLLPADDETRRALPSHYTRRWFCDTFAKGEDPGPLAEGESIASRVKAFFSPACLQLALAVPSLRSAFFQPTKVTVKTARNGHATHEILTSTPDGTGIRDTAKLEAFVAESLVRPFTELSQERPPLLIISDDGKDTGGELAKVLVRSLTSRNLAECKAYMATVPPANTRARLARGTLQQLALFTPVGVGPTSSFGLRAETPTELNVEYLAEETEVHPNGVELFADMLAKGEDNSFIVVVLAGVRDAWELIEQNLSLFRQKVARVVLTAGVLSVDGAVKRDDLGFLLPDISTIRAVDKEVTQCLLRELQILSVPMTIVTPWAATASRLPLSLFDKMATLGSPIANRLRTVQEQALRQLWAKVNMDDADPARQDLPACCDKVWFMNSFLDGKDADNIVADRLWEVSRSFPPYYCVAVLAALPGIRDRYLDAAPCPVLGRAGSVVHEVIGLSQSCSGVRDAGSLRKWLQTALLAALSEPSQKQLSHNSTGTTSADSDLFSFFSEVSSACSTPIGSRPKSPALQKSPTRGSFATSLAAAARPVEPSEEIVNGRRMDPGVRAYLKKVMWEPDGLGLNHWTLQPMAAGQGDLWEPNADF